MRPLVALAVLPTLTMFGVLVLIWPSYRQFYAGITIGCVLTMYLFLLDQPPEWIERKRRGRDGERRTEAKLRPLEKEGWVVAHDLEGSRGNLDHVVVGPGGAFLIETKALQGQVEFDDVGMVIRRGDNRRDDWRPGVPFSGSARGSAADAQRRLAADGIRWVEPVVVLWTDFPEGLRVHDRVTFLHGDRLADWLRTQRSSISHDTIGRARATLSQLERLGVASNGVVEPA